jgi:ABC-type glycerol-3-phosphate transport system substrate-binding protein
MDRRQLLRLGLGATAAMALGTGTACTEFGGKDVQVVGVWSDHELELFRTVVRGYERASGQSVEVIGGHDNLDAFIRGRLEAGHPPDLAILPYPGLAVDYAREGLVDPVRDQVADRFDPFWTDLVTVDGLVYGAWMKAAHKSLLWHRPDLAAPETWEDLAELVDRLAAADGPAPLAIGAADGWVLTDWLENLLVARAPDLYDDLARGEACWGASPVRQAFEDLARVWSIPGAFLGGGERALLTQFDESVIQVAATGDAAMAILSDFALPVAEEFRPPDQPRREIVGVPFPAGTTGGDDPPLLVGGDVAVVLDGSAAGHELMDWLTDGPEPFEPWMRAGGYLSPISPITAATYAPEMAFIAEDFHRDPDRLRFDLSDRLPGAFGAPGGSWRILQEFFGDVTAPDPDLVGAVDRVIARFDRAAGDAGCGA